MSQPQSSASAQAPARGPAVDPPRTDPRYRVGTLLGSGGMAAVWRARDERLGREVALKVLHRNLPFSSSMRDRLEREAKVAASLTHENVVQVYDYSVGTEGDSYIAMELVDGRTLRELLTERQKLPWVVVALAAYELCRGLAYAHGKGVIHRDLKPDNVMVSSKSGALKIGDFGIARAIEHTQLTATGVPVGTPAYLSPEQVRGEKADARSDIFALGISLYELTTGKLPFDAETSTGIMYQIVEGKFTPPEKLGTAEIDAELAALINRCLAPKAADRPTAAQIAELLGRMLQRRQVVDPRQALARYFVDGVIPLTETAPARRGKVTPAVWAGAGLALLVLVASAATFGMVRGGGGSESPAPAPVATPLPAPPPGPTLEQGPLQIAAPKVQPAPAPPPVAPVPTPAPTPTSRVPKHVAKEPPAAAARAATSTTGTLHLTVLGGWADVRVDGEVVGRTPTERDFQLQAGSHMLELANPHRAPYRKVVHIPPGGTLNEEVELQPAP